MNLHFLLFLLSSSFVPLLVESSRAPSELLAFVILPLSPDVWSKFAWDRLTTVALAGGDLGDPGTRALVRHAHSRGVRAVALANIAKANLTDDSYRRDWVKQEVRRARKYKLDGVNLDFEDDLEEGGVEAKAYTSLVRDLSAAFHRVLPGSEVSVDVAWSPDCIDGRCYDYQAIAAAADRIFVMSYDEQSQMWDQTTECQARANAPLKKTFHGVREYIRLGIDPGKILLGVPWYGYVYPCLSLTGDTCRIRSVPFRGCNCSDAAGSQWEYSKVMDALKNSSSHGDGGLKWDKESMTWFFNLRTENEGWHQVWFDDPVSLRIKYQVAGPSGLGLAGMGMWAANFLDYANQTQVRAMWNSISG